MCHGEIRARRFHPVCVAHEGQTHGNWRSNQVLQQSRYVEVVERKTPMADGQSCFGWRPSSSDIMHLPGVFFQQWKTSLAWLDIHSGNIELLQRASSLACCSGALDKTSSKTEMLALPLGLLIGRMFMVCLQLLQPTSHSMPPQHFLLASCRLDSKLPEQCLLWITHLSCVMRPPRQPPAHFRRKRWRRYLRFV